MYAAWELRLSYGFRLLGITVKAVGEYLLLSVFYLLRPQVLFLSIPAPLTGP